MTAHTASDALLIAGAAIGIAGAFMAYKADRKLFVRLVIPRDVFEREQSGEGNACCCQHDIRQQCEKRAV